MIAQVLTGPEWLAQMFDSTYNSTRTAKIEVVRTPENLPYVGMGLLTDPTYSEDLEQVINGKKLRDWLELIEIEINIEDE